MDFGSDFVYLYDNLDEEYISEEEYEHGMNISDSDSDDSDDAAPARPPVPLVGGGSNLFSKRFDTADLLAMDSVPPPPPAGPVAMTTGMAPAPPPPAPPLPNRSKESRKKKKVHHWRSAGNELQNAPQQSGGKGHRVRQGDTNIVSVKFNKLILPSNMHAGDPQSCTGCGAILSKISKMEIEADDKVWVCEYCSVRNVVDLEDEEVPKDQDVTFMLEPAQSTMASGPTGMDESLVIFCVDVSGSMCVTTEVSGHIELRGAESLRRARQMNRDRSDQYLPNQRRDVTYVSRLQSVQAAIDHQLQEMCKDYPNRRVALVTFSNEVTVVGDGKVEPVSIVGDKLANKDTLKTIATEQAFPDAIKTTRQALGQKLFDLEEGGPTALGPALLVSTTMAAKVKGSKVILCTDGLANVGMGKLDMFKKEGEEEESIKFYEEVSDKAAEDGVSISVITIKGTDCKLVQLGKLADKTGGQVNIVDPLKLTQEFSTILANKIIATNVVATFILHKELFFFYEDSEESKIVKTIGNVTADTEISFEYGVRSKKTEKKAESPVKADDKLVTLVEDASEQMEADNTPDTATDKDSETKMDTTDAIPSPHAGGSPRAGGSSEQGAGTSMEAGTAHTEKRAESPKQAGTASETPKELPFQLQIVYTDTEGAKALRLITQTKPVTTDRKKAEKMAKLDVIATHTARTSAGMALEGKYTMSRERALMNQRVAWRHNQLSDVGSSVGKSSRTEYKSKFGKIKSMENYLAQRQQVERSTHGRTHSDEEDDCAEEVGACMDMTTDATRKASSEPARGGKGGGKSKSFFSKLRKKRSETTGDEGAALVYKGKSARSFFEDSD